MENKLTQKRLKELLQYDPDTGIFTWSVNRQRSCVGDIAGTKQHRYLVISVDNKLYRAHRLAWMYIYGHLPENGIDHIDRVRHHNWILNLREVTQQCNSRNTDNYKNNTSGIKGIYWHKAGKKWYVQIMINNKNKYLGYYNSFPNAVCARLAGEQCVNWSGWDSSSPAYKYVQRMLGRS